MRTLILLSWAILALLCFLTLILVTPLVYQGDSNTTGSGTTDYLTIDDSPFIQEPQVLTLPEGQSDSDYTITLAMEDGTITTLTLGDYLFGVVAAEMPASFELEALKAQAVAARTYALSKEGTVSEVHPDATLCTSVTCCQAYLAPEDAMEGWGEDGTLYSQKITQAIEETDGLVLYYEDSLIEALYHSSSSGQTVDAVEVWGNDVPYLVGVDSPEGEDVPNWESSITFSSQEFQNLILSQYPDANFSDAVDNWCQITSTNSAGGVDTIIVGGATVQGTTLRTLLGLRSTYFSITTTADSLTFWVTGYGHGVGMSQYGAHEMALEGATYEEILLWYYTGVTLAPMDISP